jgi:methionine synthase II (cobalamin-independent)
MNREDEVRKTLRKDITGPYKMPGLEAFHVEHKRKEPTPQEMLDAYFKAIADEAL